MKSCYYWLIGSAFGVLIVLALVIAGTTWTYMPIAYDQPTQPNMPPRSVFIRVNRWTGEVQEFEVAALPGETTPAGVWVRLSR